MRAYVTLHGAGAAQAVEMEALDLRFAPGNSWAQARWVFRAGTEERAFPAPPVDSIGATGAAFEVRVIDGAGETHGPFRAENVIAGHPHGALCFMFVENDVDFWEGVTVAVSYGRLKFVHAEFDPA